ncbi:toxin-antitoxin system HicB family antitoxin [Streptomyces sp. NPDC056704]|uniref:toxin-antitoxin system HicB family antitoxin n=1 Tax=Streptomyces sp. NPDC056704 TaxID=3345917 RepID=UPI0036C21FF7
MIRFSLRIPEDLHERLTVCAAADRRSLNSAGWRIPSGPRCSAGVWPRLRQALLTGAGRAVGII